ncbi:nucleotide exchange factor GrpE [Paenibacillus albidus]|uniref:nucleotide exchange factor GrpE n=1 Tax=Paenibacillus albidus TaxID=2041023 RepID=UPI001BE55B30|nr:nucleotide exchange factor GrpE [Paenibacillus albidus]MBT2293726.1 nucleotide exchange factor GrpE [Paenibacillus albidus]
MWFGKKKMEAVESDLHNLRSSIERSAAETDGQLKSISEQSSKLARLTYKNGKDTLDKLERLGSLLEQQESGWKAAFEQEQELRRQDAAALESAAGAMIGWLDDLDALINGWGRQGSGAAEGWEQLAQHWQEQMLSQLVLFGYTEIQVLGTMFDPALCEAVGTVTASADSPSTVPYQIHSVLRRGYRLHDGSLFRKAQVITISQEVVK